MSRILVIEDDQLLNGGLCFNLQNAGYETIPVYNLENAYPMVKSQKFDLMLLDVNLPDGNGFDFAREIRGFNQKPLIFLTAHELDEEVMEGFALGADDYITKPFNVQIAMQRVQAVLRRTMGKKEEHLYRCGNLVIDFETRTVIKSYCQLTTRTQRRPRSPAGVVVLPRKPVLEVLEVCRYVFAISGARMAQHCPDSALGGVYFLAEVERYQPQAEEDRRTWRIR